MQSPLKGTGRPGIITSFDETRAIKRRRGRNVDVIGAMPTPRSRQLPTPETVRRPSKSKVSQDEPTLSSQLPTPQTQRRRRHASPKSGDAFPASPSGQTTFSLATNHPTSRSEISRRRPGLMFAQQMGLISSSISRGVGVGMGGHRIGQQKVDLVQAIHEDNPFLVSKADEQTLNVPVGLASPGAITTYRPGDLSSDSEDDAEPLCSPTHLKQSPARTQPSSSIRLSLVYDASGLLSPPPTKPAPRIADPNSKTVLTRAEHAAKIASRRKVEERRQMLDMEHNPFLVKPGEPSTRRAGPIVDEDQPTVTYLFRGAKRVFANPLWNSKMPFPRAELPPEDDDFEPHPLPKPKLLWPEGPSPSKRINLEKVTRSSTSSPSCIAGHSRESSPVATPTILRRFGGTSLSTDSPNPLGVGQSAFTDDENDLSHQDAEGESDFEPEEQEEELPVRRGLLFSGAGMKRDRSASPGGTRTAKKLRGAQRL
ncbi:hypothetical protein J010_02189 [Cryptococcus neoformans]|nr:hypothetical protein C355_02239 [Cryptococcus neoformans var. grubii Th84]OXH13852.1 hypothetical protein J010_02189 [Cryptococcus neoformans var. grubii]OXH34629.1 hypothetical protein J009_02203 [Cryptococcus neoformans var. grubii]OXH54766.1 hypothetical protein J004_02272 [Cryptococcus neoformans var. grubii]OXH55137.1 hypothetical protein J003_02183 [Cryptococcus neoformans var. grubii]